MLSSALPRENAYVGSLVEFVDNISVTDNSRTERRFEQIIGNSPALESVLSNVKRVAPTDSTVLILGETGRARN